MNHLKSAQVLPRKRDDMSTTMEEEFKRWTAKRKAQLVLDILQGRTTVAEASRAYDLPPSDIEEWVEDGRKGMENALRAKPLRRLPRQFLHREVYEHTNMAQ
jgi:transposase-like protein